MAIVREHLAAKGLGLHNALQNESSIVWNFPTVHMMHEFDLPEHKVEFLPGLITGTHDSGSASASRITAATRPGSRPARAVTATTE
jgi:hypothetical protein